MHYHGAHPRGVLRARASASEARALDHHGAQVLAVRPALIRLLRHAVERGALHQLPPRPLNRRQVLGHHRRQPRLPRRIVPPGDEGVLQERARRRAPLGVLDQALRNKVLKLVAPGPGRRQRWWICLRDQENGAEGVHVGTRRLALGGLDCGDAERPDVREAIVVGHLDHLGCHPERSPHHRVAPRVRRDACRDAKVGKLCLPMLVEHDVCGLDVAVDFAQRVEVVQAVERGRADKSQLTFLQRDTSRLHEV